jgi:hypothetical protein
MTENSSKVKIKIDKTDDCLSSRAGLSLVTGYIQSTHICHIQADMFSFIRKSSKGAGPHSLFHQLLCFFFDSSHFHLTHFDDLAKDESYAASIETSGKHIVSSHTMKLI